MIFSRVNSINVAPSQIMRMRTLGMQLSKLECLPSPSLELEQYPTNGELAARWLNDMFSFGDIFPGCSVIDLGAGNGILGLGSLILGAQKATFIEADNSAIPIIQSNAESIRLAESIELVNAIVGKDEIEIRNSDLIICNPPWGKQTVKADRPFIDEILKSGVTTHLMHSAESRHIEAIFEKADWSIEKFAEADFALPATFGHHSSRLGKTRAAFWRLVPPHPDRS